MDDIGKTTSLYNATYSKDRNLFTDEQLQKFSAIVFLSNSDQVLDDSGEAALQQWLTQGGSLVGLHAGTACLFNDTAFGTAMGTSQDEPIMLSLLSADFARLAGSWFDYHPTIQNVVSASHACRFALGVRRADRRRISRPLPSWSTIRPSTLYRIGTRPTRRFTTSGPTRAMSTARCCSRTTLRQ